MTISEIQFQEILSEYKKKRNRSWAVYEERKKEVISRIPEWKTLSDEIADISVEAASEYINGKDGALEELKQRIVEKAAAKAELLKKAGFPEDYLNFTYECKDCSDTGYINGEKCHCLKQSIINALYQQSNIMEKLKTENFDYYRFDLFQKEVLSEMQRAHEGALDFVESFDKEYKNLLFLGNVGSGKTFLSNCIAKALLDKGKSVIYFSSFRLFQLLGDRTFRRDEDDEPNNEFYGNIYDSDLLIIDDLGTEFVNSFVRTQLFLILNERGLRRRSTIISSNLSMQRIKDDYSERSLSRPLSGYDIYYFKGSDLRLNRG